MAQNINKIAENLFDKIRSRFEDVSLGDEDAKATTSPEQARFFNFNYTSSDGEEFGNVTVSIIDGTSIKIYFSTNISDKLNPQQQKEWYDFLHSMRKFARRNLLSFDTRDISRSNLNIKDIEQVSKADTTVDAKDVKVTESRLYGTPKTSFENVGTARIRIIHTESVNPEVRGSRARHINAIYVENAQGERFKLEHNKLSGARAMARHISEGGNPYDSIGSHINTIIKEMNELGVFVRSMRRRTFEDAVASDMMEAAVSYYNGMHRQLNYLKGPRAYRTFVENFEPQAQQLDEVDVNDIKERFVRRIFDDRMMPALPHVYKAYQLQEQYRKAQIDLVKNILEGNTALTLSINEGMDEYMKMLRFQDADTLVTRVLEDIANRAVTMPEVADFASYWAKNYININESSSEQLKENKTLAVQLATHYLKDLRQLKDSTDLRINFENYEYDLDPGVDLLDEGTWAVPKTPEDLQKLQQILAKPIPYGMDATNITSILYDVIGDDQLFDKLQGLVDDLGENADAVPAVKEWLKDNWPGLYQKLGLETSEFDAPPAQPPEPPMPAPQPTAPAQPAGQNSGGVVSEELKQMLKIAGIRK